MDVARTDGAGAYSTIPWNRLRVSPGRRQRLVPGAVSGAGDSGGPSCRSRSVRAMALEDRAASAAIMRHLVREIHGLALRSLTWISWTARGLRCGVGREGPTRRSRRAPATRRRAGRTGLLRRPVRDRGPKVTMLRARAQDEISAAAGRRRDRFSLPSRRARARTRTRRREQPPSPTRTTRDRCCSRHTAGWPARARRQARPLRR